MSKSSPPSLPFFALFAALSCTGDWLGQTLLPDSGLIPRSVIGLNLAALLLFDRRHWPALLLATFLLDFASSSLILALDLSPSLSFAAGHTLQALLSATLILRYCDAPFVLNGLRPIIAFGWFGGILGPLLGATVSATALAIGHGNFAGPHPSHWLLCWLANGTSVVIFTPLILALTESRGSSRDILAPRWGEAAIMTMVFAGVAWLFLYDQFPFGYIVMVPMLWVALRFEIAGASIAMFLLSLLLLLATASGHGIFANASFSPAARQGHAHLFLFVIALAALVMAGLTRQRREGSLAMENIHRNLEARFAIRTAELRESEARFRAIADYTYDWESWIGEDGRPIWINPAVQRFTGMNVSECAALPNYPLPLIHPDDRDRMEAHFREALRGGAANDIGFRVRHRDGREIWCAVSWQPIFDAGGHPRGFRSSVRDTTDRQILAEELRESEEAFRAMFTVSSVGKTEADAISGRFIRVNAAFCRITGYSETELLQRSFSQITHPDDLTAHMVQRQRVIRGEAPYFEMEQRYIRADGAIIWAQVTLNAVRDKTGRTIRMTGVVQDITQRRKTEQALLQSQRDLARAQEVGQIGSWRFELANHALNLSDECYRIFGFNRGQPISFRALVAIIHPDDRELLRTRWRSLLSERVAFDLEHRIQVGSQIKWVRAKAYPECDDRGEFQACFGITQDITALKRRVLEIEYLASHDSLTNLPNRRLLLDRLQQGIAMAQRDARMLAVLFLDLDKFKPVNDVLGHALGDRLLQAVAERLKTCLRRQTDTLARVGGDEFVILLPNARDGQDATSMAEEIIRSICRPFILGDHTVSIGASIGIAVFPEHGVEAENLVDRADQALYAAKESGRNCCRIFAPENVC